MKNLLHGLFSPNYLWDRRLALQMKDSANQGHIHQNTKEVAQRGKIQDTHSFHLSACYGMLIGDRLLRCNHGEARGGRGCPQIPCIHVAPTRDGVGISRRRCTKSHFPSYTWGQHMLLQATPANAAGTHARDRQGGGQQKQQVHHHGAAAHSVQTLCKAGNCMRWFAFDWPLLIQLAELL